MQTLRQDNDDYIAHQNDPHTVDYHLNQLDTSEYKIMSGVYFIKSTAQNGSDTNKSMCFYTHSFGMAFADENGDIYVGMVASPSKEAQLKEKFIKKGFVEMSIAVPTTGYGEAGKQALETATGRVQIHHTQESVHEKAAAQIKLDQGTRI